MKVHETHEYVIQICVKNKSIYAAIVPLIITCTLDTIRRLGNIIYGYIMIFENL